MKNLTNDQINKINEINGKYSNRYEYFEKLAEILNAQYTRVRWEKNFVQAIKLDESTILDIQCKTIKGRLMIKLIHIMDRKKTEEHPYGETEIFELKKGKLVKLFF